LSKRIFDSIDTVGGVVMEQQGYILSSTPAPDDSVSVEVTVDGKKYSGKLNKT